MWCGCSKSIRRYAIDVRLGLLVLAPLLLIGGAASVLAVGHHDADPAFIFAQQHPTGIQRADVEALLKTAREALPSGEGPVAQSATCSPGGGASNRGNPWHCSVRYASKATLVFTLSVEPDGTLIGRDRTGQRGFRGCCIANAQNGFR